MAEPSSPNHAVFSEQTLQQMMQRANISSQRALAEQAGVSRWQVQQLRQGNIDTMRLAVLKKLALALECALSELLDAFDSTSTGLEKTTGDPSEQNEVTLLRQEYARLEQRLEQQSQSLKTQFQAESLQVLESWLTYWPTAAKAAAERDGFDAKKLLPLVKPVERLMETWDVISIGTVGEQLPYDPQQHQLARGVAQSGELVRISHVGYRHRDNLLQRTKVVPITP
ncbi:MAG: helix-turn-helix transcriptional regulator [Cyanobacteria bacterium P01_D01_bin.156]